MSKNKDKKTKELNEKNRETQNIFNSLKQYKKKDKEDMGNNKNDNTHDDINTFTSEDNDINSSNNIYMSLIDNNENKDEYVGATHYFRKDQLKDLEIYSKKTKKFKSEFMRELMDLVFEELKRGLNESKRTHATEDETRIKSTTLNNITSKDNKTSAPDNPFGSLLEVNDSKDPYVRASHYFRQDQLDDLDKFVEKSGKSKNEFVRDAMDLVFSQLKEVNN